MTGVTSWTPRMRIAAHAIVLLILSNGPVFLVSRRLFDRPGTWEESIVQPSFIAAAIVMVVLAAIAVADGSLRRPPPALAFAVGFAAIAVWSVTWSLAPQLTGWRSWIYVAMVAGALGAASLPLPEWLASIKLFVASALALSVAAIVFRPDIGIDEFGSWQGIYLSPNSLAPVAAIGAVLALAPIVEGGIELTRRGLSTLAALAGTLIVLIGSGSATAIVALIGATVVSAALVHSQRLRHAGHPRRATQLLGITATLGIASAALAGPRLWATANFTLRRELWDLLAGRIGDRPLKGYGFFAFWDVPSVLVPRLLVRTGSAHNSFVEVVLGIGFLGLAFFVPVMAFAIVQPFRAAWKHPGGSAFAWLAVALFVFGSNLTESFVLWFSYMWLVLMASAMRRSDMVARS